MPEELMDENNALGMLRGEHERIRYLVNEVAQEDQSAARKQIMVPLLQELEVHDRIECDFFYPFMRTRLPDDVVEKPLEINRSIGHLAAKLRGLDPSDQDFVPTMDELIKALDLHIFEEEEYLFSKVEGADPDTTNELIRIATRMKDQRARMVNLMNKHRRPEA